MNLELASASPLLPPPFVPASPAPASLPPAADDNPGLLALLDRHRARDPEALDALIAYLHPRVRTFVYRVAGRRLRATSDDLVQDCMEQVCRSLDGFEGRSRLMTFVFGICFRVVAQAHRYERIRRSYCNEAAEVTQAQAPALADELLASAHGARAARQALAQLPDAVRTAFLLHEIENLRIREIAQVLGCSGRTVRRHLSMARHAARDVLTGQHR